MTGGAGDMSGAGHGSGVREPDFGPGEAPDARDVFQLEGDFAQGRLPVMEEARFPGPIAEACYWCDDDVTGIQGPVGSGKTTTVLRSRLRRAVGMPRSVIDGLRRYKLMVVRQTYRQLWSTTIPSYLETFPRDLGEWSGGRGDPVTHKIAFEDPYGRIEFVVEFMAFGDDIVQSMRGVQTTDIWLNEADTVPVDVMTIGIGRIDRWPARGHFEGYPPEHRSYGQIICDFNAPDEDNWTFGVFHDEAERERISGLLSADLPEGARPIRVQFFNQPGYGEPGCENLQNLAPGYYQRQIAAMRLAGKGDQIERLIYNKVGYLRTGEPVFSREFNRRIHVAEHGLLADPEAGGLLIGLDQGFKPAAVVAQFRLPYRWRILGELIFPDEHLMAREFGARLRAWLDDRWPGLPIEGAWGDMAGELGASHAATENATWNLLVGQAAGLRVRPQRLGTNRIQPRLEAVRAALEYLHGGEPGLTIDPSCKFLIRGFEARYVWSDRLDQQGNKRRIPDKSVREADVMDALQYLLLSRSLPNGLTAASTRSTAAPGRGGAVEPAGLVTGFDVLNPYGHGG